MKTSKDPRHLRRVRVMQDLFAWDFNHKTQLEVEDTDRIINHLDQIDELIKQSAPTWPISKINKIDLSILRQAIYELLFGENSGLEKDDKVYDSSKVPPKVVVDEAVEIAKEYGSSSSPSFVNGVLGKVIESQKIEL